MALLGTHDETDVETSNRSVLGPHGVYNLLGVCQGCRLRPSTGGIKSWHRKPNALSELKCSLQLHGGGRR